MTCLCDIELYKYKRGDMCMTCLCDIELYKSLMEEDQIETEEISYSFNNAVDVVLNISENVMDNNELDEQILFPQPVT